MGLAAAGLAVAEHGAWIAIQSHLDEPLYARMLHEVFLGGVRLEDHVEREMLRPWVFSVAVHLWMVIKHVKLVKAV